MKRELPGEPPRSAERDLPFSRPLEVDKVPEEGLDLDVEADTDERAAVAHVLDLPGVGRLAAHFHVTRRSGGRLAVTGEVEARVTQTCVVSLDPFDAEIVQPIEIGFAPSEPDSLVRQPRRGRIPDPPRVAPAASHPITSDQEDPPDPIIGGRIDLGAVAVEFMTLALDFYPKKPGVHFADVLVGETEGEKPSPFAALGRLKDPS